MRNEAKEMLHHDSLIKGKKYFEKKSKILDSCWFDKLSVDRNLIVFICRLRSNHTRRMEHLFDKNIHVDNLCECGDEVQTLNHLFFYCRLKINESEILLLKLYESDPLFIKDVVVLAFLGNVKIYRLLFTFAVENDLLI